jgi:NAD(P)-dependent dehydrogenase (short-subunit alcohol dehydrogenase family)
MGGLPADPKTVLITGASSGLGQACVRKFSSASWNVIATARNPGSFAAPESVPGVCCVRMDVTSDDSVEQAVDSGLNRFGSIDVVVNSAGYGVRGIFEAIPHRDVLRQFDVNLFGVMRVCRAVLPQMRRAGAGVIVNISSAAGIFALPLGSVYGASKFALEGFSEALSYELLSRNIVVKLVEPGGMSGTNFASNASRASTCAADIPDYASFQLRAEEVYRSMADRPCAPVEHVAGVVFMAATDGTDQLRYVATEDIAPTVRLRRETSELEFMTRMRERFPHRDPVPSVRLK